MCIRDRYTTYKNFNNKYKFEVGARLSYHLHSAVKTVRTVNHFNNEFVNPSFSLGVSRDFSPLLSLSLNTGVTNRAPQISELYIEGVHQGVASLEYGDPNLNSETSYKTTFKVDYTPNSKLSFQALSYFNPFDDYIYLKPNGDSLLTIRGQYPQFYYSQNDVLIYGLDFSGIYKLYDNLTFQLKYAYLRGQDLDNDIPLIYMSPNNASFHINYNFKDLGVFKSNKLGFNTVHTFKQNRFVLDQDYVEPPEAFTLLGIDLSSHIEIKKQQLNFSFTVDNLLNTNYRSYLNRLRYFADEPGMNMSFRLGYQF